MRIVSLDNACRYISELLSQSYAVVCIGTYLRSDDRAALELCTRLSDLGIDLPVILCEHGLENCTHEIIDKRLKRLAIFDAVMLNNFAKNIVIMDPSEVVEIDTAVTSHLIPVKSTLKYLESMLNGVEVIIIGIPVKNLDIGFELSSEVREIVDKLVYCFSQTRRE